jgi:hypothetical protein
MFTHLRRHGLTVVLALSGVLVVPSAAYACSCVAAGAGYFARHADLVLVGTVEDRDERHPLWPLSSSGDPVAYRVSVERVYQGRVGRVALIESAVSGASCGIDVEVGRDYLVYADRQRSRDLSASLCGGTRPADADALAAAESTIGPPTSPDANVVLPEQRASLLYPATGIALALAAAAAIGLGRRRRR